MAIKPAEQSITAVHKLHPHNDLAESAVKFAICATFALLSSVMVNFMSFYRGFIVSQDTYDLLSLHVALNVIDCFYMFAFTIFIFKKVVWEYYVLNKFDEQSQFDPCIKCCWSNEILMEWWK